MTFCRLMFLRVGREGQSEEFILGGSEVLTVSTRAAHIARDRRVNQECRAMWLMRYPTSVLICLSNMDVLKITIALWVVV